jgi:hypothetical protein
MMAAHFQDPRGEYSKQCPYCLEYITVDHLNRDFCPEKNGIKNFCKNRYRRLKDNLFNRGVVIEKPKPKPLKISISRENPKSKKTINDSINDACVEKNKRILESLLGSEDHSEIEVNDLLREGYETDFFESLHDTPSGFQVYKVGPFSVTYLPNDLVYITYFKILKL